VAYVNKTDKSAAGGPAIILVMWLILEPIEFWSIDMSQQLLAMDTRRYTDRIEIRLDFPEMPLSSKSFRDFDWRY
jgi:hypothetical protein